MGRKSLLAAVIALSAAVYPQGPSVAAGPPLHIFTGTVAVTNVPSPACDPVGIEIHALKAALRAHLDPNDPHAALIFGGDSGEVVQLQAQSATNIRMNGANLAYDGTYFNPRDGGVQTWTGTTSLAVTPVGANTIYVYMTGTIFNFGNAAGCDLTINAAFIQPVAP